MLRLQSAILLSILLFAPAPTPASDGALERRPAAGAPGPRIDRAATPAEVETLVQAWLPRLLAEGGGTEDLSSELRAAAARASAADVAHARTMLTFHGGMAALRGDPDGDREVIEHAAKAALERGDGTLEIKAFGDLDSDLVFVPLAPCRIADTRVTGGEIVAGSTRGFDLTAVSNFSFQGGAAGDCGGFGSAGSFAAAVLTVTVPPPAASGSLTAFAFGAPQPAATTLEYTLGQGASNTTVVRIDQGVAANELNIATTATTHVVIDAVGYFTQGNQPVFECLTTSETVVSVPAGGNDDAFAPACPATHVQTAIYCKTSSFTMPLVYVADGACSARNTGGATGEIRASRRCCRTRIP